MLAWQEHHGSAPVCPSVPAAAGRREEPRQGAVPSFLVPVVSAFLSPSTIPLALWRSTHMESVDVGSGVWEQNRVLDGGEYSAICTT